MKVWKSFFAWFCIVISFSYVAAENDTGNILINVIIYYLGVLMLKIKCNFGHQFGGRAGGKRNEDVFVTINVTRPVVKEGAIAPLPPKCYP